MLIYSLIPARSGSKRIKNKNLIKFDGTTILEASIKQSLSTKEIHKTFVSTDSKKYQKISIEAGALAPYLRPKKISQDLSSDLECFKDFLHQLKKLRIPRPDIIVHLRATYPTRTPKMISSCIKKFLQIKNLDSLRTVCRIKDDIQKMWFMNKKKLISNPITKNNEQHSLPGQILKKTFIQINCIDILNVKNTILMNSMAGKKIYGFEMNHNFDIDDLEDIKKIKKLYIKK
jgi:CMP-N-acetylneuraminic acid synthetase|tara:strand:+ start:2035 stop:2727 length:693 start_codon:yes stop_codon:yes gene_type:complete